MLLSWYRCCQSAVNVLVVMGSVNQLQALSHWFAREDLLLSGQEEQEQGADEEVLVMTMRLHS